VQIHLGRLRGKLESNLAILETHMKAVQEISLLIARAIQEDDSDGTYSAWFDGQGNGL
jgi:hypothetical protein